MSTSHKPLPKDLVDKLLHQIKNAFYKDSPNFHRDRKMLIYTITWPAQWLNRRGLNTSPAFYEEIISKQISIIIKKGNSEIYRLYFPQYLLKSIQNYFFYNGDDLYDQLKHVRNFIPSAHDYLKHTQKYDENSRLIETLLAAHKISAPNKSKNYHHDHKQMTLF